MQWNCNVLLKPSHPSLTPSNFAVKLTILKVETYDTFFIETAWSLFQLSCHNTLALQTTTDRQTTTHHDNSRTLQWNWECSAEKGVAGSLHVSNYRPISLTCIASKTMERTIAKIIYNHLLDNNLLSRTQPGFVKGRYTCRPTNLLEALNN